MKVPPFRPECANSRGQFSMDPGPKYPWTNPRICQLQCCSQRPLPVPVRDIRGVPEPETTPGSGILFSARTALDGPYSLLLRDGDSPLCVLPLKEAGVGSDAD